MPKTLSSVWSIFTPTSSKEGCAMTTPRTRLILLIAIAAVTICGTSNAQTLIGSTGAGWQTWTVTPISSNQPDLNDSEPLGGIFSGRLPAVMGIARVRTKTGFCITATGDCVGMAVAPRSRTLPFWAMPTIQQRTQAAPATTKFISGLRREIASNLYPCDCESK
jgi:hypothetical protein